MSSLAKISRHDALLRGAQLHEELWSRDDGAAAKELWGRRREMLEAATSLRAREAHHAARALLGLTLASLRRGTKAERDEMVATAMSLAEASGDADLIAEAHLRQGSFLVTPDQSERLDALDAALRWCGPSKEGRRVRCEALRERAIARLYVHGVDEALDEMRAARREAETLGSSYLMGRILLTEGSVHFEAGDYDLSLAAFEEGRALAFDVGDTQGVALANYNLSISYLYRGRLDEAEDVARAASDLARSLEDMRGEAIALISLGTILTRRKDYAAAEEVLRRATVRTAKMGALEYLGEARGQLGIVHLLRGQIPAARELLTLAIADFRIASHQRRVGTFTAFLAAVSAIEGQDVGADRLYREARGTLVEHGDFFWLRLLDLCEALLRLRNQASEVGAADVASNDFLRHAVELARDISTDPTAGVELDAMAQLVLERSTGVATHPPRHARIVLSVTADAGAMRVGDGDWIDLRRKGPARRLLAALAVAHEKSPGTSVGVDALITAIWGNERMKADSARARLYVAISQLRGLGLETCLIRTGSGYAMSSQVALVTADRFEPPLFDP